MREACEVYAAVAHGTEAQVGSKAKQNYTPIKPLKPLPPKTGFKREPKTLRLSSPPCPD
jgi:hypothetical protein